MVGGSIILIVARGAGSKFLVKIGSSQASFHCENPPTPKLTSAATIAARTSPTSTRPALTTSRNSGKEMVPLPSASKRAHVAATCSALVGWPRRRISAPISAASISPLLSTSTRSNASRYCASSPISASSRCTSSTNSASLRWPLSSSSYCATSRPTSAASSVRPDADSTACSSFTSTSPLPSASAARNFAKGEGARVTTVHI